MNRNFAIVDVVAEVVVLRIYMFGARSILVCCRYFDCAAIVLENLAMDAWNCRGDEKTTLLHFFGELHEWYDVS